MRIAKKSRKTKETDITLVLNIDGKGDSAINTGCGFLDHMLELFSKHGTFDLAITCAGDTHVDFHHTVEDVGIVLGEAFKEALGDKRGIVRYGSIALPMDEALILAAVDLSGRAYLNDQLKIIPYKVGNFDTELVKEFFLAFTRCCECNLHIVQLAGENAHHIIEGAFKAFARAMRAAVAIDEMNPNAIPSTKGSL